MSGLLNNYETFEADQMINLSIKATKFTLIKRGPRWDLLSGVMGHIFSTVKCYTTRIFTVNCCI